MRPRLMILLVAVFFCFPAMAEVRVFTTTLTDGVRVWYDTNSSVPVVDVVMSFEGAGTAADPAGKEGLATLVAAMLTEGSGTLDSVSFARALEEQAITLNATASEDRLTIHMRCLKENAARAGELLAGMLSAPQLNEADLARVRAQMQSALKLAGEDPHYRAERMLYAKAFAGHPYAKAPSGTVESIAGMHAEDIRAFVKTHLTRANVVIAAAGDVNAGQLKAMLGETIKALPATEAPPVIARVRMLGEGEVLRETMPVPQTVVRFMAPSIERDDPRFYTAYLLNHMLGGHGLFSRLSERLRQEKGLVYGIGTDLEVKSGASLISGSFATRNSKADMAVTEVMQVLKEIREKGFSQEACRDAKTYVLGAFPLQIDRSSRVSSLLLMMQIHRLGEHYITEREALFGQVSCADVNALAREMLDPGKFLVTVVGGVGDADAPEPASAGRGDMQ
jgi:zinc protease